MKSFKIAWLIILLPVLGMAESPNLQKYLQNCWKTTLRSNHFYIILTPYGCPGIGCGKELRESLSNKKTRSENLTIILSFDDEICIPSVYDEVLFNQSLNVLIDDSNEGKFMGIHSQNDRMFEVLQTGELVWEDFSINSFSYLTRRIGIPYTGKLQNLKGKELVAEYRYQRKLALVRQDLEEFPECNENYLFECNRFLDERISFKEELTLGEIAEENWGCECLYESIQYLTGEKPFF